METEFGGNKIFSLPPSSSMPLRQQICLGLILFNYKIRVMIWSHHFMGNRWGDSGNSVSVCFLGLQNHCGW